MIYLISDLHNDINHSGLKEYLRTAADEDLLIILGDVGLNFPEREEYKEFEKNFLSIKKKIAFIDGNHENHEYLTSFEIKEWNGGKVHQINENIVHLIRGNIYELYGKTFFVMGGCKSTQKWYDRGLASVYDDPSEQEIQFAYRNLLKYGNKVDYILTHKYRREDEKIICKNSLCALTEFIDEKVDYKLWYCGHWHKDERFDDKHSFVYSKLIKIE